MANSYTLTHNSGVYYKITADFDCSVNITAVGGGGGGGYRGVSTASEQTIFSTSSLITNYGYGPGIVWARNAGFKSRDIAAFSTFAYENAVWEIVASSYQNDGVQYDTLLAPMVFDKTFTVNFPVTGVYNFDVAYDRNAFIGLDGTTIFALNNVNLTPNNPPYRFTQYVTAGNHSIRYYVSRKGSGSAALVITRNLAPVTNSGGPGKPGERVTANGMKLSKGEAIYVFVGAGGKAATNSMWGEGGTSLLGYNGGSGGNAVTDRGGKGGGGGGATCVWKAPDTSNSLPSGSPGFYESLSNPIYTLGIVAAGGGGGGGGGIAGNAQTLSTRHFPTPTYGRFADAELVSITYSAYNQFMNTYGVTVKGKFDSVGPHTFHRKINLPYNEEYRIFAAADDYISIYLDNVPLIGGGSNFLLSQASNYLDLTIPAGDHIISVFYENFAQKNACAIAFTRKSTGEMIWNTRSDLYSQVVSEENFAKSYGGRGQTNSYEGGGGGGGGGGSIGGSGGVYPALSRTFGAYNGDNGKSYVSYNLTETTSEPSGIVPSGYGEGGAAEQNGQNGVVLIDSTGSLNIRVRLNDQWVPVKDIYEFYDGEWRQVSEVSVYDNSQWQNVHKFESVDLTLTSETPSGNAQYATRILSNPPVFERLPQAQLSQNVAFSQSSSGGDSGGSFEVASSTQTFDDGSTLTTTTYSDGTVSYSATNSTDSISGSDSSYGGGSYDGFGEASGETGGWV